MRDHGFASVRLAREQLARLGAPPRLLQHTALVGEAAELVLACFDEVGVSVDAHFVRLGVVFHDTGKILHPSELAGPGSEHERAGQELLLREGVAPDLARCCISHATWDVDGVTIEELLVALADKLWKGKRDEPLEKRVVERASALRGVPFWDLFLELDTAFETIAAGGAERLARSGDAPPP